MGKSKNSLARNGKQGLFKNKQRAKLFPKAKLLNKVHHDGVSASKQPVPHSGQPNAKSKEENPPMLADGLRTFKKILPVEFCYSRKQFGTPFAFHEAPKSKQYPELASTSKSESMDEIFHKKTKSPASTPKQQPSASSIPLTEAVRDHSGLRPRANSTDYELKLPRRGLCDEQVIQHYHKWRNLQFLPKGLENLGNTCFLNSILQCLTYSPAFCQVISSMDVSTTGRINTKKNHKTKLSTPLVRLFRSFLRNMQNTSNGVVAPRSIAAALPLLSRRLRRGRQEDAHECLVHLLDALHNDALTDSGICIQKSGWRNRLTNQRLDETTYIHRIFGGYLRSQIQCSKCRYQSNTYDAFLDLNLEIRGQSIMECIQGFTTVERLEHSNAYHCDQCRKKVTATKQLDIFRPPLTLLLQLKRFGVTKYGQSRKIAKAISYPLILKVPLSDGRSCEYRLTGVVLHRGETAQCGHYTAVVLTPKASWYCMDDECSRKISPQQVLQYQSQAYLLMYCRSEVKLELPRVPDRRSAGDYEEEDSTNSSVAGEENLTMKHSEERSIILPQAEPKGLVAGVGQTMSHVTPQKVGRNINENTTSSQNQDESISDNEGASAVEKSVETTPDRSLLAFEIETQQSARHSVERELVSNSKPAAKSQCFSSQTQPHSNKAVCSVEDSSPLSSSSSSSSSSDDADSLSSSSIPVADKMNDTAATMGPAITPTLKQATANQNSNDTQVATKQKRLPKVIVQDRGPNGKVEVVVRSAGKKLWKPTETWNTKSDEAFSLLGNVGVGKWDETTNTPFRATATTHLQAEESARKRRMHLDRHDAILDQGKGKKIKKKQIVTNTGTNDTNRFQKIQQSIQKMSKGRPKSGFVYSNRKPGHRRRSL